MIASPFLISSKATPSDLDYQTPRPDVEDAFSEVVSRSMLFDLAKKYSGR